MKKKIKHILCKYPENGYGAKNNQPYLLDLLGNRHDIVDEYDKTLDEVNKVVCMENSANEVHCERTLNKLISTIEQRYDTTILRLDHNTQTS